MHLPAAWSGHVASEAGWTSGGDLRAASRGQPFKLSESRFDSIADAVQMHQLLPGRDKALARAVNTVAEYYCVCDA